jgi:ParB-like nuclease domain
MSMTPTSNPPVVRCPVDTLFERTDIANPNLMDADTYDLLKEAMAKVGFLQPILVRKTIDGARFEIVDGVHRWMAAKELGFDAVPCVVLDSDVSLADVTALRIGMNRMRGDLDLKRVAEQINLLAVEGWSLDDLKVTGYGRDELAELLKVSASASPDDLVEGVGGLDDRKDPGGDEDEDKPRLLEVVLPVSTKKELNAVKKKLKKLGDGDMGLGVMRALDAVDKLASLD